MKGPEGRTQCFGAWFTDAEAARIRRAAARDGLDPSEWIRAQALAGRRPLTVSRDLIETNPPAVVTSLLPPATVVAPMGVDEIRARLAAVIPHDLGGLSMAQHDRDACPDCLSRRVQGLVRRGLGVPVARELRTAGTMAAPMVTYLEGVTLDQLNAVNAAWARALKAREVLR